MKKANPLMAGLSQFDRKSNVPSEATPVPVPRTTTPTTPTTAKQASRAGAVQIAAFFPEEVRTQLKIIAAEQRRELQDLMAEGLNYVFAKYGKAEIAPRKRAE